MWSRVCGAAFQGLGAAAFVAFSVHSALASPLPAEKARPAAEAPARAHGGRPAPLPRYLTIELRRDGTWFADGVKMAGFGELELAARKAAASRLFAGVVIFSDGASDAAWPQLFDMLSRAGLGPVRQAPRGAPPELSGSLPVAPPDRPQSRALAATAPTLVPEAAAPSRSELSPGVPAADPAQPELLTVGLHVAGPANEERNRRRLVAAFERHFGAFRRCHALAVPHVQNASFGVDLLIPAQGGKATVRQTRTRIAGGEFRSCMHRALQAIHFEPLPTARPEIVSYSVLFKPPAP